MSDKSQVRANGPINQLTRQPLKGRKRHGGIRFGEMERDSIIAHGASFLLHERLLNSSDRHLAVICDKCGRNMVIKYGPHGKFLACPGFPECRNTLPFIEKIGVKCPKCGGEVIKRRTKKGRLYYACENKDCDFMSWQRPKKAENQE